jgi:uncharacterized protein (TIGR02246 family)
MKTPLITVLAAAALLVSCAPPPAPPQPQPAGAAETNAMIKEITASTQARDAALAKGDVDGYLSAYADDAVWVPPQADVIVGKELAKAKIGSLMEQFTIEEAQKPEEQVLLGPDAALDRGTYTISGTPKKGGEEVQDVGKYMNVWRKGKDGKWLIAYQMWSNLRGGLLAAASK